MAVDTKKMDTVYGQGWDLDEVLSGRVPYPSDMDTLLQELKSVSKAAAGVHALVELCGGGGAGTAWRPCVRAASPAHRWPPALACPSMPS